MISKYSVKSQTLDSESVLTTLGKLAREEGTGSAHDLREGRVEIKGNGRGKRESTETTRRKLRLTKVNVGEKEDSECT